MRRQEHGEQIKASGASHVVYGELSDTALITKLTAAHDVVFYTAPDRLPTVEAVLAGIRQRADNGLSTVYIQTSGTAMTNDHARGAFKSDKVYHDHVRAEIDSLPEVNTHRQIDIHIDKARTQLGAKAKIAIMIPPTIYGVNPKHGRLSDQIPKLARYAIKHKFAGHAAEGLSVHSNVHVLDLARAYVLVLHYLESTAADDPSVLGNPFYFCEATGNDEPSWKEVAAVIGEGLHKAGVIPDPAPRAVPKDSYGDLYGDGTEDAVGMNSRTRAVRLRELGWKPVEKDWKASFLEDELSYLLK